jgi:hypothetical protein
MCPDEGRAIRSSPLRRQAHRFGRRHSQSPTKFPCCAPQRDGKFPKTTGNPANVGLPELTDEVIDVVIEYAIKMPSSLSGILFQTVCGAASRVASDATAFRHRAFPYAPIIVSQWREERGSDANIRWARDCGDALHRFAGDGVYVNDLGEDDHDRVRVAYGGNYERLATLKQKYDPHNMFRLNPNIRPLK